MSLALDPATADAPSRSEVFGYSASINAFTLRQMTGGGGDPKDRT